jgi:hypothetical protein
MFWPTGYITQCLPFLDVIAPTGWQTHKWTVGLHFEVGVAIRVEDRGDDTVRIWFARKDGHLLAISNQTQACDVEHS